MSSKAKDGKAGGPSSGGDGRFFSTTKKGETQELRAELQSASREKKVDAVKKVIANMTVGKDVSMLFTDVVNCIQTGNMELKKLVYLYLINYAKTQPELILLSVNTFVKDAADPNPLVRALAIRTMGCIRVERITEYLCEPLAATIKDDDPYVRKTAAMCVAKLYDIQPELVVERGFVDALRDLVSDPNPTVVANAVAALNEIADSSGDDSVLELSTSALQKLLAALNECTEWGQVSILDALAKYAPADAKDAASIIERVLPRLQHANSAVVLSAVKVILRYVKARVDDAMPEQAAQYRKKLAPPLVTLLNSDLEEITYVALRNINLIVQSDPRILEGDVKVFFCKYNDPIYVKLEKLEIMIRLVSERNVDQVLLEFKEYAQEVDVDFVRRAVRAIGRCAIKLEKAAQRCITVLLELIHTKINYVVQEAVIVVKDVFRKYPQKYESIIATLCENLESLDEPEAKASMIWIIGEYAEQIENADELLDTFLESFRDETAAVQLQLVTAAVKLFLKQASNNPAAHEMVQKALSLATDDATFANPDLRDRGFVYWRLLSSDPEAAKAVVLCPDKPPVADDTHKLDPDLLEDLLARIATLASVFHKPPEAFVARDPGRLGGEEPDEGYDDFDDVAPGEAAAEDAAPDAAGSAFDDAPSPSVSAPPPRAAPPPPASGGEVDLLDMGMDDPAPPPASTTAASLDPLAAFGAPPAAAPPDTSLFGAPAAPQPVLPKRPKTVVCAPSAQSGGVGISAAFDAFSGGGALALELDVANRGAQAVRQLAVQFNKSPFGVAPAAAQLAFSPPIAPGATAPYAIPVTTNPAMVTDARAFDPSSTQLGLQVAMKNADTGAVFYFTAQLPFDALWSPDSAVERSTFIDTWKAIDDSLETYATVDNLPTSGVEETCAKLQARNAFHVARRAVPGAVGQEVVFLNIKTIGPQGHQFLVELTFKAGLNAVKVCVKTTAQPFANLAKAAIEDILRQPGP
mmetsp:Transcript_25067/g.99696  ORF Transcript_25067/g.99696 Transcript_25067/m.99696 type:complete len:979 (-) Transcript_25067:185-3121(-)|eukprot:CAMPEP_0185700804 /NCGR_PEP_ID=MMETSP1164-20130828/7693_1 /TAXON_ID=1104430 /ORGANISM="Chrysoreinhardia sp, Strain CCMP2950" /LENGTH=978 /DNA_ID=CAMNT_0028367755 /DNA_START=64 /DNA_END=3000 /DNA_ORIENTATION=-